MIECILISLFASFVVGCLQTTQGPGEGESATDGSTVRDLGTVPGQEEAIPKGCFRVTRVVDGDTFHYVDPQKRQYVGRMLGIDATEISTNDYCSDTAHSALSSLIQRRFVRIDREPGREQDDFGRELVYVSLCDSPTPGDINLQMVQGGWACVFDRYVSGLQLKSALRDAEQDAARAESGCWENHPQFCR